MARQPGRDLNVGTIIDRTVDVIEGNTQAGLIYIAVFAVLGSVTEYVRLGSALYGGISQLLVTIAGIIGSYLLIEAMLRQRGLLTFEGERRFLPYLGQAILMGLGIGFGFILLIIPGLIVAARWSVAQPLLIGRGDGAIDSMRESWELTRGNEVPILLAGLVMLALFIAASIIPVFLLGGENLFGIAVSQIASSASSVITAAMSVALFGLICGNQELADVFE
jgi:hypothetical protein